MFENLKLRWVIILGVLFFGFYFSFPSFKYYSSFKNLNSEKLQEIEKNTIDLGLDLRGGLHIVLELDERKFLEKLCRSNLSKNSKRQYEQLLNNAEKSSKLKNSSITSELNYKDLNIIYTTCSTNSAQRYLDATIIMKTSRTLICITIIIVSNY